MKQMTLFPCGKTPIVHCLRGMVPGKERQRKYRPRISNKDKKDRLEIMKEFYGESK